MDKQMINDINSSYYRALRAVEQYPAHPNYDPLLECIGTVPELLDEIDRQITENTELLTRAEQAERERDYLKKVIHGHCWACANSSPDPIYPRSLIRCAHLEARGIIAAGGKAGNGCEHFEYRSLGIPARKCNGRNGGQQ